MATNFEAIISVYKPTNTSIIISTLKIIKGDFLIEIVRSISEGVNCCDTSRTLCNRAYTPSIVGVSCNSLSILINDCDYVALKILDEVVGITIINDTTNAVLVIVEGNKSVTIPSLTKDLRSVESIFVLNSVYGLRGTNTISVVSVSITIKGLKLSALFPSQSMTEIRGRVALSITDMWLLYYIIFYPKSQ